MRLFAPRSTDPDELTILTPVGGAAHGDEFKVASIAGVSGYQPYLDGDVVGRSGRIDLKTRKLDVGTRTLTLIDKSIDTNLRRWWSAFFGDAFGRPMGKLKMELDESLDGGATWTLIATMELTGSQLVQKIKIVLEFSDRVETLKMKVFVGKPHSSITYVAQPTLCPIGFRGSGYGPHRTTPPLTGTTRDLFTVSAGGITPAGSRWVQLDAESKGRLDNLLTTNLQETLPPSAIMETNDSGGIATGAGVPRAVGPLRCHLKRLDTLAEGVFKVGLLGVDTVNQPVQNRFHKHIVAIALQELETTDVGYMAAPAASVNVQVALYVDGEVSSATPLLLNDVDPAQYVQDLCAGLFGSVFHPPEPLPSGAAYGDPKRVVPTNGWVALEGTRPPQRVVATKVKTAIEEIERVCFENNWAPYLDEQGRLNPRVLDIPSSLGGIATLTDDDVIGDDDPAWKHDPKQAVQLVRMTHYQDRLVAPSEPWNLPGLIPTMEQPGGLEESKHRLNDLRLGTVDFGEEVITIDAVGLRSVDGETLQGQPRSIYLENHLLKMGGEFARPFSYGLITIPILCRRTATVNGLAPGSLVIADVDVLPDPATHVRGGAMLCRVLEKTLDGPTASLRLAFLASATVAAAPSLGAPAQQANNTYFGITTAITPNAAGHPVEVRYAVTETSVGTVPVDDSPLWTNAGFRYGAVTAIIGWLPPGKRIWVQGRSFPTADHTIPVPSPWTNATAPGRVDTAALPTPSALAASSITEKAARLTWTNGATDLWTEVLLATPTGDPRERVALMPPSSDRVDLEGLDASTTYRAEVRHVVGEFVGSGDTEDFTTSGSPATAANLLSFSIYGVS